MKKTKRVSKDKSQIAREMAFQEKQKAKLDKQKYIAKTIFPFVEKLKTVYDAQTVFNAVAGYIDSTLAIEVSKIKVSDLNIVIDTKKGGELEKAVVNILKSMENVSAEDVSDLSQKMGQKLAEFVANKGLKDKMTIKTADFVA